VSSEPAKLPVTVVLPVKNEELNLPRCLARLARFQRIVVVDSNSTDQTRAIAERFGCEVIPFQWNGRFPKKRNWYLMNHAPATPWVLFLDADEFVTDEFVDELARTLPGTPHAGFWILYSNHFLGTRLRHGIPMRKLPLFRVGAGMYEKIDEESWSALDMEVHEHPVLQGTVGSLRSMIEHDDDKGLHAYIAKHNEYSSWEARRYMSLQSPGRGAAHFTPAQRRKYRHMTRWWLAPAYFLYSFLWKRGFLDGHSGWAFAWMKAIYFLQIRLKIAELKQSRKP
jgi:glycosyltransferase involved in cell wall biosynthesis